jgi:hypothetical protein
MHSPITTTHAIPQNLPSGSILSETATVKCSYCLVVLGQAYDLKTRVMLQAMHKCTEKRLAKKPAVMVPYN